MSTSQYQIGEQKGSALVQVFASWNQNYDNQFEAMLLLVKPQLPHVHVHVQENNIDADDSTNFEFLRKVGLLNLPAVILFNNGKVLGVKIGLCSDADLVEWTTKLLPR